MNYRQKWVCLNPKCKAIHLDKFKKCRRCGHDFLGRRDIGVNEQVELRVDIDELHLDKELKIQARMVRYWSEQVAEAQAEYDTAKSNLATVEAELGLAIRKRPESYGIEKVNNDVVNACIIVHPEYKIASKRLIKARYELDVRKAATAALQDKKRALTLLTELYIHQYYNEHSLEPNPKAEAAMKAEQERKEEIRSRARRRLQTQQDEGDDDDD